MFHLFLDLWCVQVNAIFYIDIDKKARDPRFILFLDLWYVQVNAIFYIDIDKKARDPCLICSWIYGMYK